MSFRQRCLAAGYLPQELPPPFTSVPFADFCEANPNYISDIWKSYVSKLVRHQLAQAGKNRRILSIPNPINQLRLVQCLEQNFSTVFRVAGSSSISASKPLFQYGGFRAIYPRRDFTTIPRKRAEARAVARYMLKTDISRFYGSIYTHSVPWSLHTKEVAKRDRTSNLFGNVLDKVLREAQDGQTVGIPVGPDTSLVIAELILAAVDDKALEGAQGYRWYDDYELSALTKGECERHLVDLEAALFEFELEVNVAKTEILTLPLSIEDEWVEVLRDFEIRLSPRAQFKDLNAFFSRAFEYGVKAPKKTVLRYAVRKMHGSGIHERNWLHLQRLMAQAATHEPEVLPHVLGVLNFYQLKGYLLDLRLLERLLCTVIEQFAERALGSEVAWAIWGFIQFERPIPARCVEFALNLRDDVVLLLLLDARSRGLIADGTKLDALAANIKGDSFEGDHWLFAYESVRKAWLIPPASQLRAFRANPHVDALLASGVYFYQDELKADQTARHLYGTPTWLWYQLPQEPGIDIAEDRPQ